MKTCSHPYRGAQDQQQMRKLLVSARAQIGYGCWHVGDLVWRLFLHGIRHDLSQTLRLWEDEGGDLLGFAIFTPPRLAAGDSGGVLLFDLQIAPQVRGQGVEEQMLDWVQAQGSCWPGADIALATDCGVCEDDMAQIAALERRGFRRSEREGLLLVRPLQQPIPQPALPPGFVARSVATLDEYAQRADAHRDAFHPSRITPELYRSLMQTPGYSRPWDLVAVAPDGALAAFCLAWVDTANRIGEFEPVGTRQAFRGRGLARALVQGGLWRMQQAGLEAAFVGPIDLREQAALGLYRSAGLYDHLRLFSYSRAL